MIGMKRILVTGGTGFIGGYLLPLLEQKNYDIYSLERYITGRPAQPKKYKTVFGDLCDYHSIEQIMREVQPEIVIHLAAISPVSYSYSHPHEVMKTNLTGTINLADACQKIIPHFEQFLFASTSETYGFIEETPKTEETRQMPNSPYAVSKKASEDYLRYMYKALNFPVTILRPFNCYDKETEILTDSGWKLFKDLNKRESVATLNQNTELLEFQKPLEYFSIPYDGKMIRISGSQLDGLVTPNHRMLIRRYGLDYEIMEAKELLNWNGKKGIKFRLSADWNINKYLESKWYDINWIKFLAWWLSEGSLDRRRWHHLIDIRQLNQDNLQEIFQIVLALGYNAHKYSGRVQFSDKELHSYLKQFGKSSEKFIPDEVKNLPKNLIRLFINTYQKGDGSRGSFNGYEVCDCITSSSNRMLDDLQELTCKAGWASSKKGRFLTIARTRIEVSPRTSKNFTIEKYRGLVYCVTVPNEILYIRRNGKPMFCGNTYGRTNDYHFLVEKTIVQMLQGETCRLGDPKPVRDFMYVSDHVNAYLTCLENKKTIGDIFNFCTGIGYTIEETVNMIATITNFKGEIIWDTIPARPLDIQVLIGSYQKAKNILGWSPRVSLEGGLQYTVGFWKEKFSIKRDGDHEILRHNSD